MGCIRNSLARQGVRQSAGVEPVRLVVNLRWAGDIWVARIRRSAAGIGITNDCCARSAASSRADIGRNREWRARLRCPGQRRGPATKSFAQPAGWVGGERPPLADRNLVIPVDRETVPDIVNGVCVFIDEWNQSLIPAADCSKVAARIAGVIHSVSPGIGSQERQAMRIPLFNFGLERVVSADTGVSDRANAPEIRKGVEGLGVCSRTEEARNSVWIVVEA